MFKADFRSPVKEGVAKSVEFAEGLLRVHHQRIAGDHPVLVSVHDGYEGVGGGLRAYPHAGKVLLHKVADERCLPGGVLADQEYHWFVVEVGVFQRRRVEFMEAVRVF